MEDEEKRLDADVRRRNRRRVWVILMSFVLVVTSLLVTGAVILNDLFPQPEPSQTNVSRPEPPPEEQDPDFADLYDIQDAANLKDFLREWWYNGGDEMIRYSKDVLNVLLVGVDDNDGVAGEGRSDTMMLVSFNKKTRMTTMLSFLRDSYCYFDVDGNEYYHRLNSAYYYGGAAGMMEAISRLYKIRVDRYVTVDFDSFPKLIDALGGVTVDVGEHEARYINRTAPSMHWKFPSGEGVRLNGKQALVYSRIRKLDTDVERAGRQQKVIESILRSARSASLKQLYDALDQVLPYVRTNFAKGELLKLLPSAVGWLSFGMQKLSSPALEGEERSGVGGTINGMSILIVDYPKAAHQVQLKLYGESNIALEEGSEREAYISALFQAAEDHTRYYTPSQPATGWGESQTAQTAQGEETQATQPQEEPSTQPQQDTTRAPLWPFWPQATTTAAPATTLPPAQETEPAQEPA